MGKWLSTFWRNLLLSLLWKAVFSVKCWHLLSRYTMLTKKVTDYVTSLYLFHFGCYLLMLSVAKILLSVGD